MNRKDRTRALIVMNDANEAHCLAKRLSSAACAPTAAGSLSEAHAAFAHGAFDVALIEHPLHDDETKAVALLCFAHGVRVIVAEQPDAPHAELQDFLTFIGAETIARPLTVAGIAARLAVDGREAA
ncbi:MAG: hypothetical protein HXY28_01655 [Hydrogenophilaceae bacterium]|jgi:hypothetical protein|nr:hypothetical protein [Hydrogenophilaceae bacterium]